MARIDDDLRLIVSPSFSPLPIVSHRILKARYKENKRDIVTQSILRDQIKPTKHNIHTRYDIQESSSLFELVISTYTVRAFFPPLTLSSHKHWIYIEKCWQPLTSLRIISFYLSLSIALDLIHSFFLSLPLSLPPVILQLATSR